MRKILNASQTGYKQPLSVAEVEKDAVQFALSKGALSLSDTKLDLVNPLIYRFFRRFRQSSAKEHSEFRE